MADPKPATILVRLTVLPRGTERTAPAGVPWGRRLAQLLRLALRRFGFRAEIVEERDCLAPADLPNRDLQA
jgi:hypothetical protein